MDAVSVSSSAGSRDDGIIYGGLMAVHAGRRRTADGRREPAEEVPSSEGEVDPEIGYGESRGKGTETTQTGLTG